MGVHGNDGHYRLKRLGGVYGNNVDQCQGADTGRLTHTRNFQLRDKTSPISKPEILMRFFRRKISKQSELVRIALKRSLPALIISNVKSIWASFVSEFEIPYIVSATNVREPTLFDIRVLDAVTLIPKS